MLSTIFYREKLWHNYQKIKKLRNNFPIEFKHMIALVNEVQTTIFSKHNYIQYNNMFELIILVEELNLLESI